MGPWASKNSCSNKNPFKKSIRGKPIFSANAPSVECLAPLASGLNLPRGWGHTPQAADPAWLSGRKLEGPNPAVRFTDPYCGWTKSCTMGNHLFIGFLHGFYKAIIIPWFLRWCRSTVGTCRSEQYETSRIPTERGTPSQKSARNFSWGRASVCLFCLGNTPNGGFPLGVL